MTYRASWRRWWLTPWARHDSRQVCQVLRGRWPSVIPSRVRARYGEPHISRTPLIQYEQFTRRLRVAPNVAPSSSFPPSLPRPAPRSAAGSKSRTDPTYSVDRRFEKTAALGSGRRLRNCVVMSLIVETAPGFRDCATWHRLCAWPGVDSPATTYQPRQPAEGVLHQVVLEHLETFLTQAAELRDGEGLPSFVEQEFRDFLRCGSLGGGVARFRCAGCGFDRLVPFSCHGRAFCPSCGGRRKLIALIEDPTVIRRVLQHLGLPTDVPEARPARAPPVPLLNDASRTRDASDEPYVDDPA